MYKHFLILFVCLTIIFNGYSQEYDLLIKPAKREINGINYNGYSTSFRIGADELQKIWWRHTKKFGILDNQRGHYILKIPTSNKNFLPISLIQTTEGADSSALIFLAVLDQTNNNFKKQVKDILLEFKVQYYVSDLQQKIVDKESKLADVGASYQAEVLQEAKSIKKGLEHNASNSHKEKLLEEMARLTYELELLKRELVEIK